jgi:hypothetical protein
MVAFVCQLGRIKYSLACGCLIDENTYNILSFHKDDEADL